MRDTGIATYTIRIKEYGEPDSNLILSNFGEDQDFLTILSDFFQLRENDYYIDNQTQKVLRVANFEQNGRTINGIITRGEYGTVEPLLNIQTLEIPYIKNREEAPMFPHYFLVVIPEGADEGILMLETSGRRGAKGNLSDDIGTYFSRRFENHRVQIDPLMPQELLQLYLDRGEINEIQFTKFSIPSTDWYDEFDIQHTEEIETTLSVKGKALNAIRDRIRRWIRQRDRRNITEFVEIPNLDYEDVKVDFEVDGKHRLISLSHPFSRGAIWDITNNPALHFGDEGHPTPESINSLARDFATDILINMGIDLNVR